jgi:HAD superfamily hydrolase (TIGR01509 family)
LPIRAIVFDFDGVLANSEPLHYQAFRDVLADARVDLTEPDYYARYLGYDDVGAFRVIGRDRGQSWSEQFVADLVAEKARRMELLEAEVSILFPGAAETVRRAAQTMPVAIASGALGAEIRRVLVRERLLDCFCAIVAAEDTPKSKPSPDPYLHAVAQLNAQYGGSIAAHECVAIEDSVWGLESARAAGLKTIGVAQTYAAEALTADWIIPSIANLDIERLCRE